MKGDYTRDTFRPEENYEDVRQQQGRVQLDSDWNERGDIQRFLREMSLTDVIGDSGVPIEVEDSFEVFIDPGDGHLKVRPGRIWSRGSSAARTRRSIWGLPPTTGNHLIYLEVWRRLITAVEDSYIREVALGGPDTATREQVVCRVVLEALPGDELCPDLEDFIPAGETDGSLIATAIPPATGTDPCPVPSQAGYTGLENHLYRVQIHDGGDTTTGSPPTFKWSRDNGSILTEWQDRDARVLRVQSLGRDRVGGFHDADWVELGHDGLDLEGLPGPLVELEGNPVSADGGGLLTVAVGSSGLLFDPPVDQHAKVRRWDSGPVEITPGVPQDLESNIQVEFDDGTYRAGDYWLIPARAFIGEFHGSIEWPDNAGSPAAMAPHGVDRRYTNLAVLWFDNNGDPQFDDCRDPFRPLTDLGPGCCTVVVQVGESIQAAIDSLPAEGGCVCLKTGVHEMSAAVRIDRSLVVLHGESPGTIVRRTNGPLLLDVSTDSGMVEDVIVRGIDFRFEIGEVTNPEALWLANLDRCERLVVEACRFSVDQPFPLYGIRIGASRELTVQRCRVEPVLVGIWVDTDSTLLTMRDNVLRGMSGGEFPWGFTGVLVEDAYGPCLVEGNTITDFLQGVVLNRNSPTEPPSSGASNSVIRGNVITVDGPDGPGEDMKLFVIDARSMELLGYGEPGQLQLRSFRRNPPVRSERPCREQPTDVRHE